AIPSPPALTWAGRGDLAKVAERESAIGDLWGSRLPPLPRAHARRWLAAKSQGNPSRAHCWEFAPDRLHRIPLRCVVVRIVRGQLNQIPELDIRQIEVDDGVRDVRPCEVGDERIGERLRLRLDLDRTVAPLAEDRFLQAERGN